jgi:hypothetical protein
MTMTSAGLRGTNFEDMFALCAVVVLNDRVCDGGGEIGAEREAEIVQRG